MTHFNNRKDNQMVRTIGRVSLGLAVAVIVLSQTVLASKATTFKKQETGLYKDVFDQNFYYEGTNLLHLDRLYRELFRKKTRSANVNVYDEVPDSTFFTNRHEKQRLTTQALREGNKETEGPDLSGDLVIINGKFEGAYNGVVPSPSS